MGKCECGRLKGNPCGPLRPNTINVTMPFEDPTEGKDRIQNGMAVEVPPCEDCHEIVFGYDQEALAPVALGRQKIKVGGPSMVRTVRRMEAAPTLCQLPHFAGLSDR